MITAEEHSVIGGLGGAVSELLGEIHPTLISRVGMQDTFGESGDPVDLASKYGLTKDEIIKRVKEIMVRNK